MIQSLRLRCACLMLACCAIIPGWADAQNSPRIEFEATEHQFTRSQNDANYTHTFTFTNRGNATLEIVKIVASCGCLYSVTSERRIQPGGSGTIELSLTEDNFQLSEQTVVLHTNDPIAPTVSLTVSILDRKSVETSPREINLGTVSAGKEVLIPMAVLIYDHHMEYEVTSIQSTFSELTVDTLPTTDDGLTRRFEYMLAIVPDSNAAEINEIITIRTNVPDFPVLELPVRGRLNLQYEASPLLVLFGAVSSGKKPETRVLLKPMRQGAIFPVRVECEDSRVTARLVDESPEPLIALMIQFSPGDSLEKLSSSLLVYGARNELLSIVPVHAIIVP